MKNIYYWLSVLDENGEVIVKLSEWFEAVNYDICYLTAIRAPGSSLYVQHEISNN